MRTRTTLAPFVLLAIVLLAQADTRISPQRDVHELPLTVVKGSPPGPRFERAARAPRIPTMTSLPIRRDFRERVVASAGAL